MSKIASTVVRTALGHVTALFLALPAAADSVSISPTRVMIPPGVNQGSLTVTASGARRSFVQVRIMSWREGRPANELRPTRSVVVSPPISKLRPRQELTVRVVRTARKPARRRECYRVLVDRLPEPAKAREIALRVRHSVPLCFEG